MYYANFDGFCMWVFDRELYWKGKCTAKDDRLDNHHTGDKIHITDSCQRYARVKL